MLLCSNPYMQDGVAHGCGQCLPCRIKRRRIWQHRIMLEAMKWEENSFVTLTYEDSKLPMVKTKSGMLPTLSAVDLQNWLKRIRNVVAPARLRFFGVGEYGDESWRPHFHVALFGYKGCIYGDSKLSGKLHCDCASCRVVRVTWDRGLVHQGVVELKSAQYIAGYTVKRMVRKDDPRLQGRYPEFARMSLRPGIGALSMADVANALRQAGRSADDAIPAGLRHGSKVFPLGRYLSRVLRRELGRSELGPNESEVRRASEAMQHLREIAEALSDGTVFAPGRYSQTIFKRLLIESNRGKVAQLEARRKLYLRGKK